MNKVNIGEKIKQLRIMAGFSQSVIAEYLQVDQSYISKMENGEREISTSVIKKLAELFGCRVRTIVNDDEDLSHLNIAFRTNGLTKDDLKSIAVINRIALNLDFMQKVLEDNKIEKY